MESYQINRESGVGYSSIIIDNNVRASESFNKNHKSQLSPNVS